MMYKVLFAASLKFLCSALPAHAGALLDANVVRITSSKAYGEILFIKTDKAKTSLPGCHINLSWDYVMPLVTEQDKKLFAMLLAARAAQTPVSLSGAGNCDLWERLGCCAKADEASDCFAVSAALPASNHKTSGTFVRISSIRTGYHEKYRFKDRAGCLRIGSVLSSNVACPDRPSRMDYVRNRHGHLREILSRRNFGIEARVRSFGR